MSGVGLALDVMLLIGSGVGFALGGNPSPAVLVLVVTVAVVLVGAASVICGARGGRRGCRLGWVWALLAAPIAGVAALIVYGLVTSPAFT